MKPGILIVGAGALGKCLAALLAKHACVTLYDRDPAKIRSFMTGPVVLNTGGLRRTRRVQAVLSLRQLCGDVDILIFATKAGDLKRAVRESSFLKPRYVVFFQNGLIKIAWVRQWTRSMICRAVATTACQETGLASVTMFFQGKIFLGGDGAWVMARFFRSAGVDAAAVGDAQRCVWAKLIFSSIMNPLPVITGQGYEVLKDDAVWKRVRDAVREGRAVARAKRVRLAFDPLKLIRRVRDGDLSGIKHRGSLVHDTAAGRLTELDWITGALIRQARRLHIETPVLNEMYKKAKSAGA